MKTRIQNLALTVTAIAIATATTAWGAPQVDLLYSNASAQVYEAQSAAVFTPVSRPPAAVHWKWNRVEAQRAVQGLFPNDRKVVGEVRVVGNGATDASDVDVAGLDSLVPGPENNHSER